MAWKDRLAGRSGQQVLTGANFALYTVIVIALIVLVNWFVNNHDKRLDMTPNKKYSLSDQTRKILRNLNQDVTIYAFDQERNFGERRDLLGMYGSATNRLAVKYVDPNRQPALARELGVRNYGTIVVATGTRHMEAQGDSEEGVTNALVRVLKGERTVCFVANHGQRNLEGTDRDGYDHFKSQLGDESYKTDMLPLMEKPEIPNTCTMVVIAGPQDDYLPPEIDALNKYVHDGGRVLAMLDAGTTLPVLQKWIADLGVNVNNDLVIDENPVAQIFGTQPYMPLIIKYGNSPIVEPLTNRATLFPLSRSFGIDKTPRTGISNDWLCQTSADSYGVTNWTPKIKEIKFDPGRDAKGPLEVAVAGAISGSDDNKKAEGRFVVMGTSLIAANGFLNFQSNRDFMMNTVNWLSADEDLISIRATPPESQHLNMNAEQMRRVLVLGVFGIPLIIILAGVMVWWQRR